MTDTLKLHADGQGRLMSAEEAVEYLGLGNRPNPVGSLRWLMRTRKLAYVNVAKGIYGFRRADLDAFIDGRRVEAAGAG